jgi:hypothetical protein
MSEDPLKLGVLDAEVIHEEVSKRGRTKKSMDPIAQQNAETAAKREQRLTSGKAPIDPGPSAPPPEPVADKSALLDKITLFRERFPHIKSRNKTSAKSSIEELEDELHYIEQQLGQREGHMGGHLLVLAMTGLEEMTERYWNPLNLNLTGLGAVTRQNEDQFGPILDELFIKYGAQLYVGPEMRLAMAVGTMVFTVHSANNGNQVVAQAMEKMSKEVKVPKTDL